MIKSEIQKKEKKRKKEVQGKAKEVYSPKFMKLFILLLFTYYIIFHKNFCKPTFYPTLYKTATAKNEADLPRYFI